jgi:hypothetical protein
MIAVFSFWTACSSGPLAMRSQFGINRRVHSAKTYRLDFARLVVSGRVVPSFMASPPAP